MDGLYDVWGQFPEIIEIAPDSGVTKLFPSLDELKKIPFTPGDSREVISLRLLNRMHASLPTFSSTLASLLQTLCSKILPSNFTCIAHITGGDFLCLLGGQT